MLREIPMIKTHFLCWSLIFTVALSSCSIEMGQQSLETPASQPAAPLAATQIPVTWANLNLTGKLVYSMGSIDRDNNYRIQVQILDLVTGEVTTLYTTPINAWIYYISVSPDGKQVVMSFSPPPGEDPAIVQALNIMPLDGSKPPGLLFMPRIKEDQYLQAEWSPDGKYIYYAHVDYRFPEDPHRRYPLYNILRMAYPVSGGWQEEKVAEAAYWPRLSPDSARLVYISVDPFSITHKLTIADPDGGNAQEVVISGSYVPDIKDAPIFSPDGQSILFSGAVPVQARQPSWFERFVGIRIPRANGGVPSDWWSVPVGGGEITRLTHLQSSSLYASVSPDNRYIASYSAGGIFVMKPDGSELTLLVPNLDAFTGTVSWIP
jgi:Tol biopolymer transport system component